MATLSHISKLASDIAPLGHGVKKSLKFSERPRTFRKCLLDPRKRRQSIGNGFPVQKYIGAMVRLSIRVVLFAENDLIEVASDPDNFRFVTEVGQGGLPLYRTTEKSSG